jgi:gas vesicle protein
MTRTRDIVTALGAAMVGATAGYVVGVLSAPASGRDTRRRLGRRFERGAEEFACKVEDRMKEAREAVSEVVHGH